MKIWKQIKYPLLILLVVLVLAFSRYVALAIPSWSLDYTFFYDPLLVVRVISLGLFNSHILLDILLLFVGFFTIWRLPKNRRFSGMIAFYPPSENTTIGYAWRINPALH